MAEPYGDERLLIPGIVIGVGVFGVVAFILMVLAFEPFDREDIESRSKAAQKEVHAMLKESRQALEGSQGADASEEDKEEEAWSYDVVDWVVNPARADDARIAEGKETFTGRCAACHAGDGSGMPGLGPSFKDNIWFYEDGPVSDAEMFRYVAYAAELDEVDGRAVEKKGMMNSFADDLSPDEIWNVLAYVQTLVEGGYEPRFVEPPADVEMPVAGEDGLKEASADESTAGEENA